MIFQTTGDLEKSLSEYERLLSAYPHHLRAARYAFARAELLRQLGAGERLGEALQQLREQHPDSIYAERAGRWLSQLEQGLSPAELGEGGR